MKALAGKFMKFVKEEEGATAVEYGVLIALIIAVCIVVIQIVGEKVNNAFEKVNAKLN
jgi:pilus assembly protein Flp/PilA